MSHSAVAATINLPLWKRIWLRVEAASDAMSIDYYEVQDRRIARLEAELGDLRSAVSNLVARQT